MTTHPVRMSLALTAMLLASVFAFVFLNTLPIQARTEAMTWYVNGQCHSCGDGTSGKPFRTINGALSAAHHGDIILVAQGTYTENLLITAQVTLTGGYNAQGAAWTRDVARYKTIITSSDRTIPGSWSGDWIGSFAVLKDDYAYKMWYSAGSEIDGESIGYADSPDGINWFQPYNSSVLGPGPLNTWDEAGVADPAVVSTEDGLHMWYVGSDVSNQRAIGHATSSDGLTWQKHDGNPVLRPDSADMSSFGFPTVIQKESGDYWAWYSGGGSIWLATSPDGLSWTKHLDAPALAPGLRGNWDDLQVYAPVVVTHLGKYEMWYVGRGIANPRERIGYARSSNGITWTKSSANPVLVGTAGYWEEGVVAHPAVVTEGPAGYKLWYRGGDSSRQAIGQATSTDGLAWTKYDDNPVLTRGRPTHWGQPVVSFRSGSNGAVLDGFTISHGYADYGGGIFAYETSPIIRACRVTENAARYDGGGIWIGGGLPLIENTLVSGNTSSHWGGGIMASYAALTIQNGSITNNAARDYGGGLVAWGAFQSRLTGTTVTTNAARWGGGLYVGSNTNLNISNGRIESNTAQQAAGVRVTYATLNMTNTFVVGNSATAGGPGGIQFWHATGRLVNATMADNRADDGPGGIDFGTDDPAKRLDILNSILFFNGNQDIRCSGGLCNITYSDISKSIAGVGNISADPQFVDRTARDYHLRAGSPAIDAGTSQGAPTYDFENDPRPIGRVDMGADEYTVHSIFLPLILRNLVLE